MRTDKKPLRFMGVMAWPGEREENSHNCASLVLISPHLDIGATDGTTSTPSSLPVTHPPQAASHVTEISRGANTDTLSSLIVLQVLVSIQVSSYAFIVQSKSLIFYVLDPSWNISRVPKRIKCIHVDFSETTILFSFG